MKNAVERNDDDVDDDDEQVEEKVTDGDEKHHQNSKRNANDVQSLKKEVRANDEKQQNLQNSEDVG